jgi:hypothetical protein
MDRIVIPAPVLSGINQMNAIVDFIKTYGIEKGISWELLPSGSFLPKEIKWLDNIYPNNPEKNNMFIQLWGRNALRVSMNIFCTGKTQYGKIWEITNLKIEYKYQLEDKLLLIDLSNSEQISAISSHIYMVRNGHPQSQSTDMAVKALDEALKVQLGIKASKESRDAAWEADLIEDIKTRPMDVWELYGSGVFEERGLAHLIPKEVL